MARKLGEGGEEMFGGGVKKKKGKDYPQRAFLDHHQVNAHQGEMNRTLKSCLSESKGKKVITKEGLSNTEALTAPRDQPSRSRDR